MVERLLDIQTHALNESILCVLLSSLLKGEYAERINKSLQRNISLAVGKYYD